MPRTARKLSPTNIYHIMLRGINRQQIFEDTEDYKKFISTLETCKQLSNFKLHAFCLMGNHIHLLIEPDEESLGQIIKRIACRFVYWYNQKYHKIGHLFQDRYRSEMIENEASFLKIVRYIHQNPLKTNLTDSLSNYPWSSYHAYSGKKDNLTTTEKALSLFKNVEDLLTFMNTPISEECMDHDSKSSLSDFEAKQIVFRISHCANLYEFQALDKKSRKIFLSQLKHEGLSLGQISRLCGISKSTAAKL